MEPVTAIAILNSVGAFDWLKSKFGDSPTASVAKKIVDTAVKVSGAKNEADVVQILNADPAKAAQVAEAIRAEEMELTRLAYLDLNSARDLQKAALAQDDIFSKRYVYYFITFWSIVTMSYIVAITFCDIPENSVRYADTILGFLLGTAVSSMFQYLLGSTMVSRVKDQTINMLSKG
jgi:hypothetical protein